MTLEERIVGDIEEVHPPETPLEEVFAAVNVLNLPSKALTLLALDDSWRTADEINTGPLNHLVPISQRDFGTSKKLIENYCVHTLVPIACVAKARYYRTATSYVPVLRITEFGKKVQKAVIYTILAIQKSEHFISMYEILGETNTRGTTRQTESIPRILYAIQNGATYINEISRKTGINIDTVSNNLNALANHGLVTKSERESSYSQYVAGDLHACAVRETGAGQDILQLFKKHPNQAMTLSEIRTSLTADHSYARIANRVGYLVRHGTLIKLDRINLADKGKEGIAILDKLVYYFISLGHTNLSPKQQELLSDVESTWKAYQTDPTFVNSCIAAWNNYGLFSPHANFKSRAERLIQIYDVVSLHAVNHGISPKEISEKVGISIKSINSLLKQLVAANQIRGTKIGRSYKYLAVSA